MLTLAACPKNLSTPGAPRADRRPYQCRFWVRTTSERIDALKKIFNKHGAKIKDFYALLGQYDTLFIVDAPNDETVTKLSLYVAEQGNARIETHRAFTETEFRKLLSEID